MYAQKVDGVWLNRRMYEDAEIKYYENLAKAALTPLASEVAKARQRLIDSRDSFTTNIESIDTGAIKFIEKKVVEFEKSIDSIVKQLQSLDKRVASLELSASKVNVINQINLSNVPKPTIVDGDDNVDLFGSDSDGDDAAFDNVKLERLRAYEHKKSQKPALIAKSNVIFDVKPWDDETDMKQMEKKVKAIKTDGLLWGTCRLVPLAYGIHKLQISCVVEDDKVSIDWLSEQIEGMQDYVQSVDIAAFNKI